MRDEDAEPYSDDLRAAAWPLSAAARGLHRGVSVQAELAESKIFLGEIVELTVHIEGVRQATPPDVRRPDVAVSFEDGQMFSDTTYTIVNGQTRQVETVSYAARCILRPQRTGEPRRRGGMASPGAQRRRQLRTSTGTVAAPRRRIYDPGTCGAWPCVQLDNGNPGLDSLRIRCRVVNSRVCDWSCRFVRNRVLVHPDQRFCRNTQPLVQSPDHPQA